MVSLQIEYFSAFLFLLVYLLFAEGVLSLLVYLPSAKGVFTSVGVFTFCRGCLLLLVYLPSAKGIFILCWCIYILPGAFLFSVGVFTSPWAFFLLFRGHFSFSVGVCTLLWVFFSLSWTYLHPCERFYVAKIFWKWFYLI